MLRVLRVTSAANMASDLTTVFPQKIPLFHTQILQTIIAHAGEEVS